MFCSAARTASLRSHALNAALPDSVCLPSRFAGSSGIDALFRVQSPTGSLFFDLVGGTHNVNTQMRVEVPGRLRSEFLVALLVLVATMIDWCCLFGTGSRFVPCMCAAMPPACPACPADFPYWGA